MLFDRGFYCNQVQKIIMPRHGKTDNGNHRPMCKIKRTAVGQSDLSNFRFHADMLFVWFWVGIVCHSTLIRMNNYGIFHSKRQITFF